MEREKTFNEILEEAHIMISYRFELFDDFDHQVNFQLGLQKRPDWSVLYLVQGKLGAQVLEGWWRWDQWWSEWGYGVWNWKLSAGSGLYQWAVLYVEKLS